MSETYTGSMLAELEANKQGQAPERKPDFQARVNAEYRDITASIWYMEDVVELSSFDTDHGFQPASKSTYTIDYFTRMLTEDLRMDAHHPVNAFNLYYPSGDTQKLYEALGFSHLWIWNYHDTENHRAYLCSVRKLLDGDIVEVVKDHDYKRMEGKPFYKRNQFAKGEYNLNYSDRGIDPPPYSTELAMREELFGESDLVQKDPLTITWDHSYKEASPRSAKLVLSHFTDSATITYMHPEQGEVTQLYTLRAFIELLKKGQFMKADVLSSLVQNTDHMKHILGMLHSDELNKQYG